MAVLLIIGVALSFPWYQMERLVDQLNRKEARAVADAFVKFHVHQQYGGFSPEMVRHFFSSDLTRSYPLPKLIKLAGSKSAEGLSEDESINDAIKLFRQNPNDTYTDWFERDSQNRRVYHYVQALRARKECMECHGAGLQKETFRQDQLVAAVTVELPTDPTDQQLLWNRAAIVVAIVLASLCAIVVFSVITHYLILAPVDHLRQAAEQVASGEFNTRVGILKGDEFEELGRTFNQMLDHIQQSQEKLQTINKSLDTKLGELAEANVALHEANKIKSEFLANVSHELRTPLNSIIGFAELLESSKFVKDDAKAARYLANILTSARSLLMIINELLDLAKIEAGKMSIRIEKLVVADLCENLYHLTKPLADQKHLQVKLSLEDDVPVMETDAGKVQQILYNLLSNAIKFTPDGGEITITVQTVPPEHVRVSVTDTGPGIAEDQQEAIFEQFRQIDGSESREHAGAGLGLAIARELTTMLGGTIGVASKLGQGATFSIALPIKAPSSEVQMPLTKL